ncbi:MAG TPA: N-acetyltransferase, partial [Sulfuricurvum sp.]|nr:N-acetyltransferase [Sulfuricurvum sp.]
VMYDKISVQSNSRTVKFYERFGFVSLTGLDKRTIEDSDSFTMVKELTKKAIVRPTDGYDPRRWMD